MRVDMGYEQSETSIILDLTCRFVDYMKSGEEDKAWELNDAIDLLCEEYPNAWAEVKTRYPVDDKKKTQ